MRKYFEFGSKKNKLVKPIINIIFKIISKSWMNSKSTFILKYLREEISQIKNKKFIIIIIFLG